MERVEQDQGSRTNRPSSWWGGRGIFVHRAMRRATSEVPTRLIPPVSAQHDTLLEEQQPFIATVGRLVFTACNARGDGVVVL